MTKLSKYLRFRMGAPFVREADLRRNNGEWIEAVIGYTRGLGWMPWREDLKIRIGACLAEIGDVAGATRAFASVEGDFRADARKAMEDMNRRYGLHMLPFTTAPDPGKLPRGAAGASDVPKVSARSLPNRLSVDAGDPRRFLGRLGRADHPVVRSAGAGRPSITFQQVGALTILRDGSPEPLLLGVVAVRARIVSPVPLTRVEILVGEPKRARTILQADVRAVEGGKPPFRLHILNAWIDSRSLPPGRHWLSVRAVGVPDSGLYVTVADNQAADPGLDDSDAFVPSPAFPAADVDAQVIARPASVRAAARSLFGQAIGSVLVMRVDQLGDLASSLPAMARLKQLFPDARLTAATHPAYKPLVEAAGVADEVLTLELSYNRATEQRHLSIEEEARFRACCEARRFDLAVDLCPGEETRPLLLLSGANYLVGFNADKFAFLDFGVTSRSRDKVNQLECVPHAATVMTLVEALAVATSRTRPTIARLRDSAATLESYHLAAGGYAVLHTGARHAINRWPIASYLALAGKLLDREAGKVVLFVDGETGSEELAAAASDDRLLPLSTVGADDLDAIISNARLFVGNDSGPKHLAAVRGIPTVSIQVGRLNWREWGQDSRGLIISKRVPCTGCGLNDVELCGREAVCVRSIGVEEVFAAISSL